ncbi:GNAT family N-acetyltransferase [Paenibacillus tuaregi]|uniref:GNAT family N-acetyltransferase n=1 Tax=Paenibacillus tuaregi TaxID=1816681 RepID=UPI000839408B|nr:GNAT family N-acetyltransferase [Paenibacillus tuaregi]
MDISKVIPDSALAWSRLHSSLLAFTRKYGAGRITQEAYRKLQKLTPAAMRLPGCAVFIATVCTEDGPRLAGLSLVTAYGDDTSIVVVHPLYRGRQIGARLLKAQLAEMGRIRCRVALDNVPSLKMCFNAGLKAGQMIQGPTGKPTLVLEKSRSAPEATATSANLI